MCSISVNQTLCKFSNRVPIYQSLNYSQINLTRVFLLFKSVVTYLDTFFVLSYWSLILLMYTDLIHLMPGEKILFLLFIEFYYNVPY